MKRVWLPAALALVPPIALQAVADVCLRMVTLPKRLSVPELRATELEHGFGDCVEAYETKWSRETFDIERGGALIRGELIENPADCGARRKIAAICHGHTANRYGALKYADIFYRAGFSVLIYDERYFGESGGAFCTLGQEEAQDLAAIFALVKRRFGDGCLVALHGESMGAATVLLSLRTIRPDMVVADCPFADSILLFQQWIRKNLHLPPALVLPFFERSARRRYNYRVREVSPIEAVRQAEVPICLMHGRADTLIPCTHSEALFGACRHPDSELHLFDGAEHAQSIVSDRSGYEASLLAFLKRCGAL